MSQLPIESAWLKAGDFDEPGLTVVVAQDPEYKEGKTIDGGKDMFYFYYFMKPESEQVYTFQNGSIRLANAWNEANPEVGDTVHINGIGSGMKRTYEVTKS